MTTRASMAALWALMRRAVNEVVRVPGAAIPAVLAPAIFMLGITAVFGKLAVLPGFTTESYMTFIIAISLLQGAGFTGAATGVNLARDIEQGWFDRLLASPAPRWVILLGTVLSASMRALMPVTLLLIVGFSLGVEFPGIGGLALAIALVAGFSAVVALYAISLALRFRTQQAAPLMQAGTFMAVLFTTSYAPLDLLEGWLHDVAQVNPVTKVVEAVRQGFVADVTWADTWPALLALAGLGLVLGTLALRGMMRTAN